MAAGVCRPAEEGGPQGDPGEGRDRDPAGRTGQAAGDYDLG